MGSEQTVKVDVRIICATNRDLAAEVARGRFRADLFYRLSVFPITVPPLRERESDIPLVATHLLSQETAGASRPCSGLTVDTLAVLHRHNWPGNVRELDNALRYALIKSGGTAIRPEHLPPLLLRAVEATSSDRPGRQRKLAGQAVADALRTAGGNKVTAARLLGVGRATLYRYLATQEPEASGASTPTGTAPANARGRARDRPTPGRPAFPPGPGRRAERLGCLGCPRCLAAASETASRGAGARGAQRARTWRTAVTPPSGPLARMGRGRV